MCPMTSVYLKNINSLCTQKSQGTSCDLRVLCKTHNSGKIPISVDFQNSKQIDNLNNLPDVNMPCRNNMRGEIILQWNPELTKLETKPVKMLDS